MRVLLADDQELTKAGIRYLLEQQADFQVVGEVRRWNDLSPRIRETCSDVVVLDYLRCSEFTLSLFQQLRDDHPAVKIFILTADTNQQRMLSVLQTGVEAFLTKSCSAQEIAQAFRALGDQQKFYCTLVLDLLTHPDTSSRRVRPEVASLSGRELQIIHRIAQDLSTQQIADQLALSPHTINAHRKRILKKLDVTSPVGLVTRALHLDIIRLREGQVVLSQRSVYSYPSAYTFL